MLFYHITEQTLCEKTGADNFDKVKFFHTILFYSCN